MMVYVEWLRVRRALVVVAWIAGILLGCSIVARIAMNSYINGNDIAGRVSTDPGTKTSTTTLPDGTKRVTLDDPDGTHVLIEDRGYDGKVVTVHEPLGNKRVHDQHVVMGSISVNESTEGNQRVTVIRTNDNLSVGMLFVFGTALALLVATILAGSFAIERDGHLEYAFTRPASRLSLVLQTMFADIAGIVIAAIGGSIVALLMIVVWQIPHLEVTGAFTLVNGVVVAIAWYAFLAAVTASMRRGYAIVLGLSIPAFLIVLALGGIGGQNAVAQTVHAVFHTLSFMFPMLYLNPDLSMPSEASGHFDMLRASTDTAIAAGLAVLYGAATMLQWRRAQA